MSTAESRRVTATLQSPDGAGGTTTVALGSHTFPDGSRGASVVLGGTFTLAAETKVTYRVVGTGGTEAPALSWIGVHEAGTVDRTELTSLLAQAQQTPRAAYTVGTWNALRAAAVAGNTVQLNVGASQAQVDAASSALRTALDALEEVAYLPLADYRIAVEVGAEIELPETVALRTISGAEQQVPVTWSGTPATDTAFRTVTVAGTANSVPVTLVVEVVPARLEYFIDAAGTQGGSSPAFDAVAALRGEELRNTAADASYTAESGWGLLNPIGAGAGYVGVKARAGGVYDITRTTGWWASGGSSVNYELWLPAGEYEISSGYAEWWNVTRQIVPSVTTGGQTIAGTPVALSGSATAASTIAFTHAEDGPVQFRAARGTGSADPVLSWVAVAAVGEDPVEQLNVVTTVTPRCLAGKAYLYVSVTNNELTPVALTVTTPLGNKSFPALAPGKAASLALNSRATSIDAGSVGVSATSETGTFDGDTAYSGITCG